MHLPKFWDIEVCTCSKFSDIISHRSVSTPKVLVEGCTHFIFINYKCLWHLYCEMQLNTSQGCKSGLVKKSETLQLMLNLHGYANICWEW